MSFDVNVLSAKPVIKPAASMQNDGGGGNLGYMFQGRRQNQEGGKNIFEAECPIDSFGSSKVEFQLEDDNFSFREWFSEVINAIKALFGVK